MIDCLKCSLTNRPWATTCGHCGRVLQDPDSARERRREWDELPEQLRKDLAAEYDGLRRRFDDRRKWIRRCRLRYCLLGSLAVGLYMNLAIGFQSPLSVPIDLALGWLAALRLNVQRGGAFRGLGLFVLTAVISVCLHAPFIDMKMFWQGGFLASALMIWCLAGVGYSMGLKLDWKHFEAGI